MAYSKAMESIAKLHEDIAAVVGRNDRVSFVGEKITSALFPNLSAQMEEDGNVNTFTPDDKNSPQEVVSDCLIKQAVEFVIIYLPHNGQCVDELWGGIREFNKEARIIITSCNQKRRGNRS